MSRTRAVFLFDIFGSLGVEKYASAPSCFISCLDPLYVASLHGKLIGKVIGIAVVLLIEESPQFIVIIVVTHIEYIEIIHEAYYIGLG